MIGKSFGSLVVISEEPRNKRGHKMYKCKCVCGGTITTLGASLRAGSVKSCCFIGNKKHGLWKSKEYKTWSALKDRCLNHNSVSYKNYGGRGIKVCEKWINNFENFLQDVGFAPSNKHSIERLNTNGHYEPANVKWATAKEQANNRRSSVYITFNGVTKSKTDWCIYLNIPKSTFHNRIRRGWTLEKTINEPVKK